MDRVDEMRIFVRVAETGSFSRASEQLGLPRATVSTAVRQLEQRVRARLFHRTTRRVELTLDGQSFLDRCRDVLVDMDELEGLFVRNDAEVRGRVRVDMPGGVARNVVIPHLPSFLQRHPHLQLELSSTDRRVDLVREGFDCVVRVGHLSDSALIARPLGHFRMINCASPAYIERYGTPSSLAELDKHVCVHYAPTFANHEATFDFVDGTAEVKRAMRSALTVSSTDAYQAACLAGLGIIQVPEPGVREMLEDGRLVRVLTAAEAAPMPVTLMYAQRRHLSVRLRQFMDWLVAVLKPHLL